MWKIETWIKTLTSFFLQGMWCWRRHATSGIITFTFNNYCTWPVTQFPIVQLTDIEIKDDIGIKNGILRKRFIRELKELKKTADYTSCDGGLTANFLSRWKNTYSGKNRKWAFMNFFGRVGPEYRGYTYSLIQGELSLDLMQRLSAADLEDILKVKNSPTCETGVLSFQNFHSLQIKKHH